MLECISLISRRRIRTLDYIPCIDAPFAATPVGGCASACAAPLRFVILPAATLFMRRKSRILNVINHQNRQVTPMKRIATLVLACLISVVCFGQTSSTTTTTTTNKPATGTTTTTNKTTTHHRHHKKGAAATHRHHTTKKTTKTSTTTTSSSSTTTPK